MDGSTLGFQCRRSPSNEIGCRLGEGIDLVQNDLLIGERNATVTATCNALIVTLIARSTPRTSSLLFLMMISMEMTPC